MKANTFTSEAIVLWRKKRKYHSILAILTRKEGIIRCSVPHKRAQTYKNVGYLQPLSRLHVTVCPAGDMHELLQFDGIHMQEFTTMDDIMYAAIAGEVVTAFFPDGPLDRKVYQLLSKYIQIIRGKSFRLGTVIVAWHLLALAGIVPTGDDIGKDLGLVEFRHELESTLERFVHEDILQAISQVLQYSWRDSDRLSLSKDLWKEVETILYTYVTQYLGYELHSIQFIRSLEGINFNTV